MATLLFAPGESQGDASRELRSWLGGKWGMLFSHPDDFIQCDFELDRWISLARRTFDLNGVRPLALAMSGERLDAGWVSQLTGDTSPIALSAPSSVKAEILHACSHSTGRRRLVMIADANMNRRWMYTYDFPSSLPSPLELAHRAGALRGQSLHLLTQAA